MKNKGVENRVTLSLYNVESTYACLPVVQEDDPPVQEEEEEDGGQAEHHPAPDHRGGGEQARENVKVAMVAKHQTFF